MDGIMVWFGIMVEDRYRDNNSIFNSVVDFSDEKFQ